MSQAIKRKEPDEPDGDLGSDMKKQKKNVDPNNDVRIRIDRHLHKILTNLRNYYGLDNKSAIKNVILMVLHDAGFRYNTEGEVWRSVQSPDMSRTYNVPINQVAPSTPIHNTFFGGSNQLSHIQLPQSYVSPNNQNGPFVNSTNTSKPDHLLPSFQQATGPQQPIYLLPQFASPPQMPFYGQNQPQPPHVISNEIDYSQHLYFHQSYPAAKLPSTNPIGNANSGKSPVDAEDDKNGIKIAKATGQSNPSASDVNSAASTLLNFDNKNSSESKKTVMSIANLSAPILPPSPKKEDASAKPSILPSIASVAPLRLGPIQTAVSPSQWRRYNSKFSNFGVSIPPEWTEPKEVAGALHSVGDFMGSTVILNVRYKSIDRPGDLDLLANEFLMSLKKDVPNLGNLALNNSILNGVKTKIFSYGFIENVNMSFLRWVNAHLRSGGYEPIATLEDLGKGFSLLKLLNVLAEGKFPDSKIKKAAIAATTPKSKFEQIDCLSQCFQFIKDEKIHIENIGPDDLLKENQKIILGLVWSLIRHYQINKGLKGLQSTEPMAADPLSTQPDPILQPATKPIRKWTRVKVEPPPPPPNPPPPPPLNFHMMPSDEDNPPPPPPPPLPPYVVFEEVEVVAVSAPVVPTTNNNNVSSNDSRKDVVVNAPVNKNDKGGENNARSVLLREVQRRLEPGHADLVVRDFSSSFADGRVFCALVHQADPNLIDYDVMISKSNEDRLSTAFDILENKMGAFKILEAEDFTNVKQIDEKSVMTYIATVLPAIDRYKNSKVLQNEDENKKIAEEKRIREIETETRKQEAKRLKEEEERKQKEIEDEKRRVIEEERKKKEEEGKRIELEKKRIEEEKRKKELEEKTKKEELLKKDAASTRTAKSPVGSPRRAASPIRVSVVAPKSPKKKKVFKVPVKFYDSSDSSDSDDVVVNVKFSKNSVSVSYTPKTAKK